MTPVRSKKLGKVGAHRLVRSELLGQCHDGTAEGSQVPEVHNVIDLRRGHEEDDRVTARSKVGPFLSEPVRGKPPREEDVWCQQLAEIAWNILELLDVEWLRVTLLNG